MATLEEKQSRGSCMEQECVLLYARKTGVLATGDEEAGIGVSSCMSDSVMKQVRSQLHFGVTAQQELRDCD